MPPEDKDVSCPFELVAPMSQSVLAICTLDETDGVEFRDDNQLFLAGNHINNPDDIVSVLRKSERWPLTQLRAVMVVQSIAEAQLDNLSATTPEKVSAESHRYKAAMQYRQGLDQLYTSVLAHSVVMQETLLQSDFIRAYLS
jgi:hypothetical protein